VAVDPQLLVIESRDADSETHNFGSVVLQSASSGQVDLLIPAMDQVGQVGRGWAETELLRYVPGSAVGPPFPPPVQISCKTGRKWVLSRLHSQQQPKSSRRLHSQ